MYLQLWRHFSLLRERSVGSKSLDNNKPSSIHNLPCLLHKSTIFRHFLSFTCREKKEPKTQIFAPWKGTFNTRHEACEVLFLVLFLWVFFLGSEKWDISEIIGSPCMHLRGDIYIMVLKELWQNMQLEYFEMFQESLHVHGFRTIRCSFQKILHIFPSTVT